MDRHPTDRTPTSRRVSETGRKAVARERVFELKLAGVSFRAIGKELSISHTYAIKLYREALEERTAHIDKLKDQHVTIELERLDKLILSHWPNRGNPQNAQVILRCLDTKAKLLGLNAPTKVDHTHDVVIEDKEQRRRRVMEETLSQVEGMTPDQLTAEASGLLGG